MSIKQLYSIFLLCTTQLLSSQELQVELVLNAELVNQTNQQIFTTLERSIKDFFSTQVWTSQSLKNEERIQCSFVINIKNYSADRFEGTLQIQSQKRAYGTNYSSPVFNFLDKDVQFIYQEFQPLFFNAATFDSNLVSLFGFYAYITLGLDAASFSPQGGDAYFEQAQRILNLAQNSGFRGWRQNEGNRNRFWLIDELQSNTFRPFQQALYIYHRKGIDQLSSDPLEAKKAIIEAIQELKQIYDRRPNAFLLQVFFDAKADEIVEIFRDGPEVDSQGLKSDLQQIAPFFNPKWRKIR